MPTNNPQTPVQMFSHEFLSKVKKRRLGLSVNNKFVEGGISSFQLPQAGLANTLWIWIQGTIVVAGTISGGTWATYPLPAPFSLVNRMSFYSNNNYRYRDLAGWSWYKWVRDRYGWDYQTACPGIGFSPDVQLTIGNNIASGNKIVAGANVAAGTYHFSIAMPVPVSYNWAGDTGLIALSTENVLHYLDLSWGTAVGSIGATGGSSSLINGLTGSGISVTATVNIAAELDYFMPTPDMVGRMANFTSQYMAAYDQTFFNIGPGPNVVQPPPTDYYTWLQLELVNNAAPIGQTSITNAQWQYAGQVFDFLDYGPVFATRNAWLHKNIPLDGTLTYDFGTRLGNPMRRDRYDSFNNQSVTGLQLGFQLPGGLSITQPAQISAVYESLRPFQQAA